MRRPAARAGRASAGSALVDDPDRVPELRPVHQSRAERGSAVERAAQLAGERAAVVERVHPLADQRRAAAARAAFAAGEPLD